MSDRIDHSSVGEVIGAIASWNRQDEMRECKHPEYVMEGRRENEWVQKKMERLVLQRSRFKKKQLRKIRKGKVH